MNYTKQPKETRYAGTLFRSRLEARWAAFFDLAGWRWTYEPCDFDGWSPDFLLHGDTPVYVEVKPILEFCEKTAAKIKRSRCMYECLLVGEMPGLRLTEISGQPLLGWLGCQPYENDAGVVLSDWEEAAISIWEEGGGKPGFCGELFSYHDRISGDYNGTQGSHEFPLSTVSRWWGQAHEPSRFTYPK